MIQYVMDLMVTVMAVLMKDILTRTRSGEGVCRRFGELSCRNGSVNDSCQVGAPTRNTDENCNGLDENCNGQIDEDFIPYPSPPCGGGICQQVGQIAVKMVVCLKTVLL